MSSKASEAGPMPAGSVRQLVGPLIAIIVGIFMVILDTTAVNVALPKLGEDFNRPLSVVQWTITGYALAQAAVIPLAGWMSDRFGAKRVFIGSLILFTLGSGLCALAETAEQLIAYRLLQGLGGGMVVPIAFAVTYRISPPDKVGSIMGLMGIPILLAPAAGPIVSGYLVDYVSWQWIFLINLPIGVIGVILCMLQLPKLPSSKAAGLDFWGVALGPLAFAGLSYGISEGGTSWSSERTIIGLAVGGAALIAFIAAELLRKRQPLLELRVFRSSLFSRGIIVQWVLQFVMFGIIFMIPYFMQRLMGMDAFHAGLWTLPQALAAAVFMPIGGRLYDRIGARPLLIAGLALVSVGAYLIARIGPDQSAWAFLFPRAMLGMGMGLSFLPLNTYLIQSAPANLVSRVTSLTSATQQVVTSFAVAGLTTILANRTNHYSAGGNTTVRDAMGSAFHDTYLILACMAVLGLLLGVSLRKPKAATAVSPEHSMNEMMG